MQISESFLQERMELDAIVASGIFSRAPNLALILNYVCVKYFEGTASEIKEYNIAVEALGRPAEFDQRRDLIVRVEAHRLRKRLRDFYLAHPDHPVQIEIPAGQYAPRFIIREEGVSTIAIPAKVEMTMLPEHVMAKPNPLLLAPAEAVPNSQGFSSAGGFHLSRFWP